jgi:uncharacterized protein
MTDVLPGAMMVIAKTPVIGRVKTRLCPPLSLEQACDVAWACLLDTLDTAALVPAARHVLVLDGEPGPWIPDTFEVIAQRGNGLAERLAAAFSDVADTGIVVAMDTPQIAGEHLSVGLTALADGADAVLGLADDGGYWVIGLRRGAADVTAVFESIPMSTSQTGGAQRRRLDLLGLRITMLPSYRDIDTMEDLYVVVAGMADGRLPELLSGFS